MGLIILMAVCAAYVLVDVVNLAQRLNKLVIAICSIKKKIRFVWFNRKPLNCKTCLTGWFTFLLLIDFERSVFHLRNTSLYFKYDLMYIPFIMCVAMVASVFLNQILYKLL